LKKFWLPPLTALFIASFFASVLLAQEITLGINPQEKDMIEGRVMSLTDQVRKADLKKVQSKLLSPAVLKSLKDAAIERKKRMIELLQHDPDAVVPALLSKEERESLKSFCNDCVEENVNIEGTVEVLVAEDFKTMSKNIYVLETEKKEKINLYPVKGLKQDLKTGTKIRVKGLKLDGNVLFDGQNMAMLTTAESDLGGFEVMVEPLMQTSASSAQTNRKTLVIMVFFQNTSQPSITLDQMKTTMDNASAYYRENSYQKLTLSGIIQADRGADVFGWYVIPLDLTCNNDSVKTPAFNAVSENAGINVNDYDEKVIIANFGSCGWSGIATIKGDTAFVDSDYTGTGNYNVVAHEIGHNLGEYHANFLDCGNTAVSNTGCSVKEYGDVYDVMGSSSLHFNAHHKELVNFFDPGQMINVKNSGIYSLEPIETNTGGLKALKIQRGTNDYLYVEYRQPLGYDINITTLPDASQGAMLHTGLYATNLIDVTPTPGSVYTPTLHV
jgi:hypothetical protein